MIAQSSHATFFARSVRALILCTSLTLASTALSTSSRASDATLFFDNGYNLCDARLLADFWQTDIGNAKTTAGSKFRLNKKSVGKNLVNGNLASARGSVSNTCSWDDTGLAYEDMVALAAYWDSNPQDAKAKVQRLLFNGKRRDLKGAVKAARDADQGNGD